MLNSFFARGGATSYPSGLPVWARYKADAQSETDGADVATLTDQSGNGRHAVITTTGAGIMRFNAVNGKRVVDLAANAAFYQLPNMSALTECEIFYILKCDADNQPSGFNSGLHQIGTSTDNSHYEYSDGTVYEHFGRNAIVGRTSFVSALNTATYHCYNVSAKTNIYRAFQNNVSKINDVTTFTPAFNAAPIIGGNRGGGYSSSFDGRIAEVVICSTKLTTNERFDLHSYFNYEYGLTMTP